LRDLIKGKAQTGFELVIHPKRGGLSPQNVMVKGRRKNWPFRKKKRENAKGLKKNQKTTGKQAKTNEIKKMGSLWGAGESAGGSKTRAKYP